MDWIARFPAESQYFETGSNDIVISMLEYTRVQMTFHGKTGIPCQNQLSREHHPSSKSFRSKIK